MFATSCFVDGATSTANKLFVVYLMRFSEFWAARLVKGRVCMVFETHTFSVVQFQLQRFLFVLPNICIWSVKRASKFNCSHTIRNKKSWLHVLASTEILKRKHICDCLDCVEDQKSFGVHCIRLILIHFDSYIW